MIPTDHNSVIALKAVHVRLGWGPGFICMEHGTPDIQIVNSPSGVCANAPDTHSTGIFAGHLKHIKPQSRYLELGFAHVDLKSHSFHVSLPEDQLLLQFLQWFCDDDQVICIQVSPGTACTTHPLGECFQNHEQ